MKKLILFDIDRTIFDTVSFRRDLHKRLSEVLKAHGKEQTYEQFHEMAESIIQVYGFFDVNQFVRIITTDLQDQDAGSKVRYVFNDTSTMKSLLYEEVQDEIMKFSELGEVGILSQGEEGFQRGKLVSIMSHIHPERIHIAPDKKSIMQNLFKQYSDYQIYYIDDLLAMLEHAKQQLPSLYTLWIVRFEVPQTTNFTPDKKVHNLVEVYDFVKNT